MASGGGRWRRGAAEAIEEFERRRSAWVPIRTADHLEEEGRVVVMAPRFKGRAGKAVVRFLRREQTYRLRLDEYGSEVWRLVDGRRDVGAISELVVERFGDSIKPTIPRLVEFLRRLRNVGAVDVTTREKEEREFK